jgi:large subunit ribosomal protein L5e
MAFVKVRKTKSYFKRFQTKFRRRREGKTDYQARKNMIIQDRDKYNTPKYRLVVRRTNTQIICQITYATIRGDRVLCAASSFELKKYGVTAGLTNYAASYATGLLIARRLLKQLGMDKMYAGQTKVDGNDYDVTQHANEERRPFLAVLDVGLARTTTGNRAFGALKGATDGGLNVPHNTKRFPGASSGDEGKYDAKKHKERIFGNHVQTYINLLKKEGADAYKKQFSKWDECLKKAGVDTLEKLYTKVHTDIRGKPERAEKKKVDKKPQKFGDKRKTVVETGKGKYLISRRLTHAERKANIDKKIAIATKKGKK